MSAGHESRGTDHGDTVSQTEVPVAVSDVAATTSAALLWVGDGEPPAAALEAVREHLAGAEPWVATGKGAELRGQLIEHRCTTLVVAGLPPATFLRTCSHSRLRLLDGIRAGVQTFGYLCTDGSFVRADRRQVIADLLGPLGAPYHLWRAVAAIWSERSGPDNPILAYGGKANDWLAHHTRSRWMPRTGAFGLAYNCYLGPAQGNDPFLEFPVVGLQEHTADPCLGRRHAEEEFLQDHTPGNRDDHHGLPNTPAPAENGQLSLGKNDPDDAGRPNCLPTQYLLAGDPPAERIDDSLDTEPL